ncbi:hypothetical protein GIB67_011239 [Kingdonia uniflora]|uniref:Uncharacterized protein n=1 Tax=Kingdonia uniflora TaxID=39325 RepID=A0A7J7M480_9MAGN|nr:hypothetical protein GIB67_011239 [Kingdonia uniflora]
MLEEKNDVILGETLALDICSLIFKSFGAEKALEVKYFDEEMDHLQGVIGVLEKGIRSMVEMLEVLTKLREEVEERKSIEDEVLSEIQEKGNEVNQWETRASILYEDLQISNICVVLFEEKVHEYAEACESFEGEKTSKDAEIEQLKEMLIFLKGENEGMLIIKSIKRKQFTKQPSEDKSLEDELDSPRSPTIPTLEDILTKEMLENDTTTVASEREPTNESPILQKHVNRKLFSVIEKSDRTAFDNMEDAEDINDDTSNDRSNNNVKMDDKEENISEEEDKLNIIFIVIQYFMIFR